MASTYGTEYYGKGKDCEPNCLRCVATDGAPVDCEKQESRAEELVAGAPVLVDVAAVTSDIEYLYLRLALFRWLPIIVH